MSTHPHNEQNEAAEANSEQILMARDLYFATFGVRLDSRYMLALRSVPLTPDQKVRLIHDVLQLTDYVLDRLPDNPPHTDPHP